MRRGRKNRAATAAFAGDIQFEWVECGLWRVVASGAIMASSVLVIVRLRDADVLIGIPVHVHLDVEVDNFALERDGAVLVQLDAGGAALQQDSFAAALGGLDEDVAAGGLLVIALDGLRQIGTDAGVLAAQDD